MQSFYYKRGRRAAAAVVMAFFAIGAGRLWRDEGGTLTLAFAAAMTLGAAKAASDAMNRKPALKFDRNSLWVRKTWGGVEEIPWREIHDLATKMFTVRYMGLVPIGRRIHLTVTCEGGTFGARRLRLSTTAMGMSAAQSAALLAALKQAQLEAVGEAGVAMAGAGSRGWGVDTGGRSPDATFDADAAMARYLASREGERASAPALRPPPRTAMPLRPSFGRRAS